MRSLSLVEAALFFAVGWSVLSVGIPAFLRNLHASRLVEPIDGLGRIAKAAAAQAALQPISSAYPASVSLTPAVVPAGTTARASIRCARSSPSTRRMSRTTGTFAPPRAPR